MLPRTRYFRHRNICPSDPHHSLHMYARICVHYARAQTHMLWHFFIRIIVEHSHKICVNACAWQLQAAHICAGLGAICAHPNFQTKFVRSIQKCVRIELIKYIFFTISVQFSVSRVCAYNLHVHVCVMTPNMRISCDCVEELNNRCDIVT